jgi:NAD(P)-dependent dehydrogenase (short-subunit alcohol dehydrogenase family)
VTQLDGAAVLITGANGGLGREWVTQAIDRGAEKVYATDITLVEWDSDRIVPLRLDVTDQDSIERSRAGRGYDRAHQQCGHRVA